MKALLRLVLLTGLVCARSALAQDGEWNVVLWEALFPQRSRANLVLDLERLNGQWLKVAGHSLGAGNGIHLGVVDAGEVTAAGARFKVRLSWQGDQWVREEHYLSYAIELTRQTDGTMAGTFAGNFDGQPVNGRASGHRKPVARPVRAGFVPVASEEHPRVLFRKADLPRLRERLKTPMGQALWGRGVALAESWKVTRGRGRAASDPILMGVLYQLTGEQRFAEAAQMMVDRYQLDPNAYVTDFGGGSGGCGHAVVASALTYDLCAEAWPADYRKEFRERLLTEVPMLVRYLNCTSGANNHPCSNYYGPAYGGAAIATLALLGEKGPAPVKPLSALDKAVALRAAPAADGEAVAFVPDTMPGGWLFGSLPVAATTDVLASLGGCAAARPIAGTRAESLSFVNGKPVKSELRFQKLPAAAMTGDGVDLAQIGVTNETTLVLHTMLKVASPLTVGLVKPAGTRVWLGGAELSEKHYYRLETGQYAMTVLLVAEQAPAKLRVALSAAEGAALAWRQEEAALREAMWKAAHAEWERAGADPSITEAVELGYWRVYRHWRLGIGDGGFQAETGSYADIASWYPLAYAALYPNVFGRPASAYPDVTHLMPRRMMQAVFAAGGKPRIQKLNSAVGYRPDFLVAAWPIAPAEFQAAMLWGWNRVCGVNGAADTTRLLSDGGLKDMLAFLNYPLDGQPEPPAKTMPLTWEAPGFGYHCFRNGWEGRDEFVAQAFLKASLIGGWNHPNAGTFRIQGLGREWVSGSINRVGFREQEPVVLLPEDEINEGACGKLLYRHVAADGSGILSVDLGDVYSAKGGRLYDRNLLRLAGRFKPSGITGLRAWAFDYSGKSGAPLLLALVDKIDGGKRRVWQWTLPPDALGGVKTGESGFAMDYGDASMKLTFITPGKLPIKAGAEEAHIGQLGDGHRSFEGVIPRVKAAGDGHFFAVATFQRGPAPALKIEGEGLNAKVTIGRQTVRFDGTKLVLGD